MCDICPGFYFSWIINNFNHLLYAKYSGHIEIAQEVFILVWVADIETIWTLKLWVWREEIKNLQKGDHFVSNEGRDYSKCTFNYIRLIFIQRVFRNSIRTLLGKWVYYLLLYNKLPQYVVGVTHYFSCRIRW